MTTPLDTEIRALKGFGASKATSLQKLGIFTIGDLISHFPRAYEDRRTVKAVCETSPGESVCVKGVLLRPVSQSRIRNGLILSKAQAADASGVLHLTFFNQAYVKNALKTGEEYVFFGKVEGAGRRREMQHPVFEPSLQAPFLTRRIVPIYPLTAGITGSFLTRAVQSALAHLAGQVPDCLPAAIRRQYGLMDADCAYRIVHAPPSFEALEQARHRLAFEELFLFSLGLMMLRQRRVHKTGHPFSSIPMEPFYEALPFSLTAAQRRVIAEASRDLQRPLPMNRLLQGDVGSGKTMVAAALIYQAAKSGYQTALMAPTELLAKQHIKTLSPLLEKWGIKAGLLTGSLRVKERNGVLAQAQAGEIDLLIGTHALLSEPVAFSRLGLVITDEQHRFGVAQRSALVQKGENPHVLVMSATPIPRTLALILYGDLDISVLDELPPGRQPVDTFVIGEDKRSRLYAFVQKLISAGRQAYIVCPLIGQDQTVEEEADTKAVLAYTKELQETVFPGRKVACVHGRMRAKEKDEIMGAFAQGHLDILVSTTVIEVGVDVPNAALMVIENAERFGLSQLHQLRGRVGRGRHKSYCVLLSPHPSEETRARLNVLRQTGDGFQIAEADLQLRGPGDFFGVRQHGLPSLKVAQLSSDISILQGARQAAEALYQSDPGLSLPEHLPLQARVKQFFRTGGDNALT